MNLSGGQCEEFPAAMARVIVLISVACRVFADSKDSHHDGIYVRQCLKRVQYLPYTLVGKAYGFHLYPNELFSHFSPSLPPMPRLNQTNTKLAPLLP